MDLPDHLSVSQINRFLQCPLSYKFRYIDGIETGIKSASFALGTAFHAAAEELHRHLMDGGVREPQVYEGLFADALSTEFGNFEVPLKEGESQDTLTQEGGRLIEVYVKYRTSQPGKVLTVEQRIERELVNVQTGEVLGLPFVGFLDLIERDEAGLVVIDLKTAARSYRQTVVDGSIQLTCYALLVLLETSNPPRLRIDAVVRNKTPKIQRIETTRTEDDLVRFWALARSVRQAIEAGNFYPNPGNWSCATCEYAEHCRRWGMKGR